MDSYSSSVNSPRDFSLISLGCPKNLVDSERMAGLLQQEGWRFVRQPEGADFVVVNTCGFIAAAREEAYRAIEEMLELKRRGRLGGVIVAGCLAQRDKETLLERYPEIDQILGVFSRDEIAAAAGRLRSDKVQERLAVAPFPNCAPSDAQRLRITPKHVAYLKIAEGCNRSCAFCTIPQIRGPYASKPIEQVVEEAEELIADGARELVLVAQDTTYYGIDSHGRPQLASLLRRLDRLEKLAWIRLMYLYPMHLTDDLLNVLANSDKVLPYLDLPLQHISDDILRSMRRSVSRADTELLLDRLRRQIPNLVLRTTLMTGFPGETEKHFAELLDFVRRQRFERLGAFCYSDEPGTAAAGMDNKVPDEAIQARRDRLLAAQQKNAFDWNKSQVGRTLDAIIDATVDDAENAYVGRTYADAPEIDGAVYVTGEHLAVGQIVPCEIVAARDYDLIGVAVVRRAK
jgi:ribosomal protein S12 methylthiotransferase